MNRVLFAAVLSLSLSAIGCAADVDDPVPTPPAPEPQRNPPAQALSGAVENPFVNLSPDYGPATDPQIAPRQKPPLPWESEQAPADR